MAVAPWRRAQGRPAADECPWREREAGLAVGGRLGQGVADSRGVDPLAALPGDRRAGAVPPPPFQAWAVVPFAAHGGIPGEAAVGRPRAHVLGVVRLEASAPHEQAREAAANGALNNDQRRRGHGLALKKARGESSSAPAKTPSLTPM